MCFHFTSCSTILASSKLWLITNYTFPSVMYHSHFTSIVYSISPRYLNNSNVYIYWIFFSISHNDPANMRMHLLITTTNLIWYDLRFEIFHVIWTLYVKFRDFHSRVGFHKGYNYAAVHCWFIFVLTINLMLFYVT